LYYITLIERSYIFDANDENTAKQWHKQFIKAIELAQKRQLMIV